MDSEKTTMDVSKKTATDTQNAFNEPVSEHSNVSSSNNNSLDSSASQLDKFQDSSKIFKTAVTKNTIGTKIIETASTMLNISQNENHKSLTTNVINNEEEYRVEISGGTISIIYKYNNIKNDEFYNNNNDA